jgi:hypothetical protein
VEVISVCDSISDQTVGTILLKFVGLFSFSAILIENKFWFTLSS